MVHISMMMLAVNWCWTVGGGSSGSDDEEDDDDMIIYIDFISQHSAANTETHTQTTNIVNN